MPTMGDIVSGILDAPLPSGAAPILARRRGPEQKIAQAKAEEREAATLLKAKRALKGSAHKKLKGKGAVESDPVLETMLKKIATKGVVELFNAVRNAQKDEPDQLQRKDRKRKRQDGSGDGGSDQAQSASLSKDSFLDVLRRGSAATANGKPPPLKPAEQGPAAASFLRDDFMLGRNRAKDYEREEEDGDDVALDGHGADIEDDDE